MIYSATSHADVIWPPYVLFSKTMWWAIAAGLLIEYLFVRKITNFGVVKSILVNISMNAISCLLGISFITKLGGIIWEGILRIDPVEYLLFIGTYDPIEWLVTFLIAVLINALLESFVINKLFKKKLGWGGFWWLFLANGISVGIAFIGISFITLGLDQLPI